MAYDSVTHTPLQIIAGDADVRTKTVTALANEAIIPALTPMKRDAAHKAIPATAVTDAIIGITIPRPGSVAGALVGKPISATDSDIELYTSGDFFDLINWENITAITGDTAADRLLKDEAFDGTAITIRWPAPGLI